MMTIDTLKPPKVTAEKVKYSVLKHIKGKLTGGKTDR